MKDKSRKQLGPFSERSKPTLRESYAILVGEARREQAGAPKPRPLSQGLGETVPRAAPLIHKRRGPQNEPYGRRGGKVTRRR